MPCRSVFQSNPTWPQFVRAEQGDVLKKPTYWMLEGFMRSVAVFSDDHEEGPFPSFKVTMDGVDLDFGLIHEKEVPFRPQAPESAHSVLVHIKGFSCNFRDKALIFLVARKPTFRPPFTTRGFFVPSYQHGNDL
jgi:hypothetical protein